MKRLLLLSLVILAPLAVHAQSGDFVPLLPSLPGIDTVQAQNSLAPFLSQIYKICIGVAAVLAVLQIMFAGVMYMGGDSITEKKEARARIGMALAGLLLVLSPVIVFSIINPKILDLNISSERLESQLQGAQFGVEPAEVVKEVASKAECDKLGGKVKGDANTILCVLPADSSAAKDMGKCGDYKSFVVYPSCTDAGRAEDIAAVEINTQCCVLNKIDVPSGSKCCAVQKPLSERIPDIHQAIKVTRYTDEIIKGDAGTGDVHEGTVPADTIRFNTYYSLCRQAKGTMKDSYGSRTECSEEDKKTLPAPKKSGRAVMCIVDTITCKL